MSVSTVADDDIRLAVVQFMRDMNMPAFRPDDCAKLLANRLKILAVEARAPSGEAGMAAIEALATTLIADAYEYEADGTRHSGPTSEKIRACGYAAGMKATAQQFLALAQQPTDTGDLDRPVATSGKALTGKPPHAAE